jgi:alkylmercury lyase
MESTDKIDLGGVADAITRCHLPFDTLQRRVSLTLYDLLAEGSPVARAALARRAEIPLETVDRILGAWPGVYRDAEQRVVGYWGLTLPSAYAGPHWLTIAGRTLAAWCAWDTLFLPERLGRAVEIASMSPAEDQTVRLRVLPGRIEQVDPADTYVSFLMPPPTGFEKDVITSFCHFIHFFPSRRAGDKWTAQRPGTFLLAVAEAHDLARRVNAALYGDALPRRTP